MIARLRVLLDWTLRYLWRLPWGSRSIEAPGGSVTRSIGSQTQRRLASLQYRLTLSDNDCLIVLGLAEFELEALHGALGAAEAPPGAAGRAVESARREIDVVLSQPDGLLAAALRAFPSSGAVEADVLTSRLSERLERIIQSGRALQEAIQISAHVRERSSALVQQYGADMPNLCDEIGLHDLVSGLSDITTPGSASRLAATVVEIETLLSDCHAHLSAEVSRHVDALARLGEVTGAGAKSSLEAQVRRLRHRVAEKAGVSVSRSVTTTCEVADAHVLHLNTTSVRKYFIRRTVKKGARRQRTDAAEAGRSSDIHLRWLELCRFDLRQDPEQSAPVVVRIALGPLFGEHISTGMERESRSAAKDSPDHDLSEG